MSRRCRQCKKYHVPKDAPAYQWWGNDECKKAYLSKPQITHYKLPKAKPKRKKLKSIAKLVDEAAVLLQKLVRLKAADSQGYCKCVTCGKIERWQELEGGHFIQRNRTAVKVEEENVAPQCHYCNHRAMKTTLGVLAYENYMIGMYGKEFVDELVFRSKQPKKYARADVMMLKADFEARIREQEARLGI